MKKNISLLLLALALSLAMQAQDEKKVAIFDPVGEVDASLKNIIREEVSSIVVNTSGYTVLERQLINKVLEENKFQEGGLVDDSQVSEIGKRMGADYVFVTTVSPLDRNYYISCKMIEVVTARIEKQKTASTRNGLTDLVPTIQNIVKTMFVQGDGASSAPQNTVGMPSKELLDSEEVKESPNKAAGSQTKKWLVGAGIGIAEPDIKFRGEIGTRINLNAAYFVSEKFGIAASYLSSQYDNFYIKAYLLGTLFTFQLNRSEKFNFDLKPMLGLEMHTARYVNYSDNHFCVNLNLGLRWAISPSVSLPFNIDIPSWYDSRYIHPYAYDIGLTLGINYHF